MTAPARILVRLPNWLGDVLLARPLLHARRASFPEARLMGVAPKPLLDLLEGDAALDERRAWPTDGPGLSDLMHTLQAWAPEAAVILPPSFSSAWWAFRSGARVRIGYAADLRSPLLTRALRRADRGDRHLADEYVDLGRALGAREAPLPALRPPAEGVRLADERLAEWPEGAGDLAVIGPAAIYGPAKRWPAERFAAVARALIARGLHPIVCGTAEEREVCEQVTRRIGGGARSLAGETGLAEVAALCARARIAVCNDSGLAHLAAAMGTPTVAVFGSTSSAWTAPVGPRVRVVQRPPVCSPCFQRRCAIGTVCLTAVSERDVLRCCDELLDEAAA